MKWQVTLIKGKNPIIVENNIHDVKDVLSHFENEVGFRPASISKID
jgi:uncharacterized protein YlzI (FlbEa/FlbD family)